jgi:L-amino acid N-acyltransferase
MLIIRLANIDDLGDITEIYNDAVINTVATFDTTPKTLEEQRAWFAKHGSKYPVLVAEQGGAITGWASLSLWSDRPAYADTAEISLYIKTGHRRQGVGRQLTVAVLQAGRATGLHTIIARIAGGNDVSVRLVETLGFEHIGTIRECGRKFGKLLDVELLQLILY